MASSTTPTNPESLKKGREIAVKKIIEICDSSLYSYPLANKIIITIYDAGEGKVDFWLKCDYNRIGNYPVSKAVEVGITLSDLFKELKNARQNLEDRSDTEIKIHRSFHISGFMGFPQLPERTIKLIVRPSYDWY